MATAGVHASEDPLHTAEELLALGEDAPFILIEGRLVEEMPSGFRSTRIAALFVAYLVMYARPRKLGEVCGADGGFILQRDPDTVLSPDAAFIRADRLSPSDQAIVGFLPTYPDLAVEVLSPSNRAGEVARKVEIYSKAGVPLVWVIDPERETATVYAHGREPVTLARGDALDGGDVLPGFTLPLDDVFR